MGGTIMGADPGTSVANGYGQAHAVDKLFIAGPGSSRRKGRSIRRCTIHALSARTAEYMIDSWSRLV
jgi:choline dehydrogenase-like flavoprotein